MREVDGAGVDRRVDLAHLQDPGLQERDRRRVVHGQRDDHEAELLGEAVEGVVDDKRRVAVLERREHHRQRALHVERHRLHERRVALLEAPRAALASAAQQHRLVVRELREQHRDHRRPRVLPRKHLPLAAAQLAARRRRCHVRRRHVREQRREEGRRVEPADGDLPSDEAQQAPAALGWRFDAEHLAVRHPARLAARLPVDAHDGARVREAKVLAEDRDVRAALRRHQPRAQVPDLGAEDRDQVIARNNDADVVERERLGRRLGRAVRDRDDADDAVGALAVLQEQPVVLVQDGDDAGHDAAGAEAVRDLEVRGRDHEPGADGRERLHQPPALHARVDALEGRVEQPCDPEREHLVVEVRGVAVHAAHVLAHQDEVLLLVVERHAPDPVELGPVDQPRVLARLEARKVLPHHVHARRRLPLRVVTAPVERRADRLRDSEVRDVVARGHVHAVAVAGAHELALAAAGLARRRPVARVRVHGHQLLVLVLQQHVVGPREGVHGADVVRDRPVHDREHRGLAGARGHLQHVVLAAPARRKDAHHAARRRVELDIHQEVGVDRQQSAVRAAGCDAHLAERPRPDVDDRQDWQEVVVIRDGVEHLVHRVHRRHAVVDGAGREHAEARRLARLDVERDQLERRADAAQRERLRVGRRHQRLDLKRERRALEDAPAHDSKRRRRLDAHRERARDGGVGDPLHRLAALPLDRGRDHRLRGRVDAEVPAHDGDGPARLDDGREGGDGGDGGVRLGDDEVAPPVPNLHHDIPRAVAERRRHARQPGRAHADRVQARDVGDGDGEGLAAVHRQVPPVHRELLPAGRNHLGRCERLEERRLQVAEAHRVRRRLEAVHDVGRDRPRAVAGRRPALQRRIRCPDHRLARRRPDGDVDLRRLLEAEVGPEHRHVEASVGRDRRRDEGRNVRRRVGEVAARPVQVVDAAVDGDGHQQLRANATANLARQSGLRDPEHVRAACAADRDLDVADGGRQPRGHRARRTKPLAEHEDRAVAARGRVGWAQSRHGRNLVRVGLVDKVQVLSELHRHRQLRPDSRRNLAIEGRSRHPR
mmetsp:Transcript_37270/g.87676  ORF Transcript_37270/g.87676 Transcript_37270/m.87676 type:complete len:1057 (-) Transcript_37270:4153-7323(-)